MMESDEEQFLSHASLRSVAELIIVVIALSIALFYSNCAEFSLPLDSTLVLLSLLITHHYLVICMISSEFPILFSFSFSFPPSVSYSLIMG